jgi:hypothetical protein
MNTLTMAHTWPTLPATTRALALGWICRSRGHSLAGRTEEVAVA